MNNRIPYLFVALGSTLFFALVVAWGLQTNKTVMASSAVVPVDEPSRSIGVGSLSSNRVASSEQSTTVVVSYTASSENFANPERGMYQQFEYHSDNFVPLWQPALQDLRENDQVTLVLCLFYLELYVTEPISETYLDNMQVELDKIRDSGLKCIVRIAYTDVNPLIDPDTMEERPATPPYGDADKTMVLNHIGQLEPILRANADIIAVVQTGFIGVWGEWYFTDHFVADPNFPSTVTSADYANRFDVVTRTLQALPITRSIQLRTPRYKTNMFGVTVPITPALAHSGSDLARTGHHNDCFLASSTDAGTYVSTTLEYPYLEAETRYLPMGGETCAYNPPRSDCPTAQAELAQFHWSYLHRGYNLAVLNSWGDCLDEITRRLGYRFELIEGTYDSTVAQGDNLNVTIVLRNVGYAAPFNPRDVQIILEDVTRRAAPVVLPVDEDPRFWLPGTTVTLTHAIPIPSDLAVGNYRLRLNLPDPVARLADIPAYAIRLANVGTWISNTGYNDLQHTITVVNETGAGTTYYVSQEAHASDANPGTLAQPWATLQHSADTMVAGDTVLVRAGVYTAGAQISTSGSAADGMITYKNFPGETPIIDGSALTVPPADNGLFMLENVSYVRIEGFELRNYRATNAGRTAVGIYVSGAGTQLQIVGNHIHHISSESSNNSDAHAIAVYGTEAPDSINNLLISDNTIHDLELYYSEALVLNGNVEQFEISRNTIHDADNIAIDLIGFEQTSSDPYDQARDGVVQDNVVYNIDTLQNTAYLERSAAGIYVDGGTRIRIERNLVYSANLGIELASEHANRATSYITVANNVLHHNHLAGLAMGGYDELRGSTTHTNIFNNTFYHNDTDAEGNGEIWIQYDTSDIAIKNNIIWAGAGSYLLTNYYNKTMTYTLDHNLYFTDTVGEEANWVFMNTDYQGLTAWQSATGFDSNSQFADPQFVTSNEFDWHLQPQSPAVDMGDSSVDSGLTDIDGQPRIFNSVIDIGADEVNGVLTQVELDAVEISAENSLPTILLLLLFVATIVATFLRRRLNR